MDEAQIKVAKDDRSKTKRLFTMSVTSMDKAIRQKKPKEVVREKFSVIYGHWRDLADKHATYTSLAFPDDDQIPKEENEYIDSLEDDYDNAMTSCDEYVKEAIKVTNDEQKNVSESDGEAIKKQRRLLKYEASSLKSQISSLQSMLTDDEIGKEAVEECKSDMKKQLEKYETVHREYILLLEEDEVDDEVKLAEQLKSACLQMSINAAKFIEKIVPDNASNNKQNFMELKLERMKMPSFSGEIRDYPRFKSDFKKHVMPSLKSKESSAYVLKSCLSAEPLSVVKNVDEDIDDMWERLDDKYGRISKLIDAIIFDIEQLRSVPDGDNKKFMEFVDTIEKCHRDLQRIGMEREISNSAIVGRIEKKLPPNIKSLWCVQVSDTGNAIDDADKFPHLLPFLLKHRRAIEYGSSDLRTSSRQAPLGNLHHIANKDLRQEEENDKRNKPNIWCWIHKSNDHYVQNCPEYTSKTADERMDLVKKHRACWTCLRTGHNQYRCFKKKECIVDGCSEMHHPTLHQQDDSTDDLAVEEGQQNHLNGSGKKDGGKRHCLLQIMQIPAGNSPKLSVNAMWDSGATVSMITFQKAQILGLNGLKARINIVKVGGQKETIETELYDVPLYDMNGQPEIFKAYGIEQISSSIESANITEVTRLLSIDTSEIKRPIGEVDMLIGFEYAGFHPEKVNNNGHLLHLKNKFGSCIGGSHITIEEKTNLVIQEAEVCHVQIRIEDFYESESLGIRCNPRCGGCKCGECAVGGKQYTIQEERELAIIDDGLTLENQKWTAKYPWKKDPSDLPNNYPAALAMLRSTERRLKKDEKQAQTYCEQIQDMITRGVARKLSEVELKSYSGPIHYVSHHEVMKPDSASTPCRIVFNSSANYMGQNLNEFWLKGPDLLNNLLGVLLRFRENVVGFVGDVRKMYHSVQISEIDQHTHRFLWRNLEENRKPDTYVITAVSFGDKPAGAIASLALRKTAELSEEKNPVASGIIKRNAYMDDILGSEVNTEEVQQMTRNIDSILSKGGFHIKEWIMTSDVKNSTKDLFKYNDKSEECTSKVLGVVWDTVTDQLYYKAKLNFSEKKRKLRSNPDLELSQIKEEFPKDLTRRMVLSQVNGIYDPIGLLCPFVLKAKILLRDITSVGAGWDEPLPEEVRAKWLSFFTEMFNLNAIAFPRSLTPLNAIREPVLVIFSDASKLAFGACAYIRWKTKVNKFESRLIMAKSRLAPKKELTMPRLELNAAVMSSRMYEFIMKEMTFSFERQFFIVDSEIARAMIQKESYGFNTFVAVRVGEIQHHTNKEDWFWTESSENIADMLSRGADPDDIGAQSRWQVGPEFLSEPIESWPIRQSYSGAAIPELAKVVQVNSLRASDTVNLSAIINCQKYSSYDKLISVTARVMAVFKGRPQPSLKNIAVPLGRNEIQNAERSWILESQADLSNHLKAETLSRLCAREENGVMIVGTRLEKWESITYDNRYPVLLSAKSPFAKLYVMKIHNAGHLGVSSVMTIVRRKYWIVGLRQLVKSIRFKCVTCKKLDARLQQQVMGQIPSERLRPAPQWSYSSVDIFGPYEIKGETNKRSRSKGYGVLFNCLLSRSVYLDLATDYSTDAFLLVIRRFMSLKGCPVKVWSDNGSQLVAASKELKKIIADQDKDAVIKFSSSHGFDWEFCAPDAPWQNACAESLVKSVKRALSFAIGVQVLSFTEMLTVMFETAELVNQRPIGKHPTSLEDGAYISPNDLSLGRASSKIPTGNFSTSTSLTTRYHFVQRIISSFWKRWTANYFPSLLIRQKWHTAKRNVKVGDVVLIQDSNQLQGKWKLGKVVRADASLRDGFVRIIDIQHKNPGLNSLTTITRPVQKVIVIVPVDEE